jgi:hypothetical protein
MRNKLFTAFEARKENKFCRKNKIYAGTWTVSPSFKRRQLINEHIKHNIMSIATTNFRTSYYCFDNRDAIVLKRIMNINMRKSDFIIHNLVTL